MAELPGPIKGFVNRVQEIRQQNRLAKVSQPETNPETPASLITGGEVVGGNNEANALRVQLEGDLSSDTSPTAVMQELAAGPLDKALHPEKLSPVHVTPLTDRIQQGMQDAQEAMRASGITGLDAADLPRDVATGSDSGDEAPEKNTSPAESLFDEYGEIRSITPSAPESASVPAAEPDKTLAKDITAEDLQKDPAYQEAYQRTLMNARTSATKDNTKIDLEKVAKDAKHAYEFKKIVDAKVAARGAELQIHGVSPDLAGSSDFQRHVDVLLQEAQVNVLRGKVVDMQEIAKRAQETYKASVAVDKGTQQAAIAKQLETFGVDARAAQDPLQQQLFEDAFDNAMARARADYSKVDMQRVVGDAALRYSVRTRYSQSERTPSVQAAGEPVVEALQESPNVSMSSMVDGLGGDGGVALTNAQSLVESKINKPRAKRPARGGVRTASSPGEFAGAGASAGNETNNSSVAAETKPPATVEVVTETPGEAAYREITTLGLEVRGDTQVGELAGQLVRRGWRLDGDYLTSTLNHIQSAIDHARAEAARNQQGSATPEITTNGAVHDATPQVENGVVHADAASGAIIEPAPNGVEPTVSQASEVTPEAPMINGHHEEVSEVATETDAQQAEGESALREELAAVKNELVALKKFMGEQMEEMGKAMDIADGKERRKKMKEIFLILGAMLLTGAYRTAETTVKS